MFHAYSNIGKFKAKKMCAREMLPRQFIEIVFS